MISPATTSNARNNIRDKQNFARDISIILVVMYRQLYSGYSWFCIRLRLVSDGMDFIFVAISNPFTKRTVKNVVIVVSLNDNTLELNVVGVANAKSIGSDGNGDVNSNGVLADGSGAGTGAGNGAVAVVVVVLIL